MPDRLLVRASAPDDSPALPDELYVADLDGNPQWSERRVIGPGLLALAYPRATPFAICALWEIPSFGKVQTPSAKDLDLLANARSWDPSHPGYWHRPWDPEVQADWVERFYTIAVGKPYVEAVSWWSMSDRGTFFPHGGVLDRNDEPKPAFHRLKALIAGIRGEAR